MLAQLARTNHYLKAVHHDKDECRSRREYGRVTWQLAYMQSRGVVTVSGIAMLKFKVALTHVLNVVFMNALHCIQGQVGIPRHVWKIQYGG